MTLIKIGDPHNFQDQVEIDAGANQVEITRAFIGVMFVTEDNESLAVSMRDTGFEIAYYPSGQSIRKYIMSAKAGQVNSLYFPIPQSEGIPTKIEEAR